MAPKINIQIIVLTSIIWEASEFNKTSSSNFTWSFFALVSELITGFSVFSSKRWNKRNRIKLNLNQLKKFDLLWSFFCATFFDFDFPGVKKLKNRLQPFFLIGNFSWIWTSESIVLSLKFLLIFLIKIYFRSSLFRFNLLNDFQQIPLWTEMNF